MSNNDDLPTHIKNSQPSQPAQKRQSKGRDVATPFLALVVGLFIGRAIKAGSIMSFFIFVLLILSSSLAYSNQTHMVSNKSSQSLFVSCNYLDGEDGSQTVHPGDLAYCCSKDNSPYELVDFDFQKKFFLIFSNDIGSLGTEYNFHEIKDVSKMSEAQGNISLANEDIFVESTNRVVTWSVCQASFIDFTNVAIVERNRMFKIESKD